MYIIPITDHFIAIDPIPLLLRWLQHSDGLKMLFLSFCLFICSRSLLIFWHYSDICLYIHILALWNSHIIKLLLIFFFLLNLLDLATILMKNLFISMDCIVKF